MPCLISVEPGGVGSNLILPVRPDDPAPKQQHHTQTQQQQQQGKKTTTLLRVKQLTVIRHET
jgi:hypothetical protein